MLPNGRIPAFLGDESAHPENPVGSPIPAQRVPASAKTEIVPYQARGRRPERRFVDLVRRLLRRSSD